LKHKSKSVVTQSLREKAVKLVETYVKAPFLKEASLLIMGECAPVVLPDVCKGFVKGRVVLTSCPEAENSGLIADKLAAILVCSNPREIMVLTVDGSPYCFTLHASVNKALFLTKADIPSSHFVIVDGEAMEISPESVRVGRYLHLVQKCIENNPEVLGDLRRHSLEYRCLKKSL
jgi:hypothetical protein